MKNYKKRMIENMHWEKIDGFLSQEINTVTRNKIFKQFIEQNTIGDFHSVRPRE
jgi:hypothetical protein